MADHMKIGAAAFKAKCLGLMERVATTRKPLVVTKHGRPLAKVVPADEEGSDAMPSLLGYMEGTVHRVDPHDTLFSTEEEWEADA